MLRFDNKQTQIDLLQPQAYQIASAKEEWFPPVLHRKYMDLLKKETLEERRDAKETERQEREKELEDKRSRRADSRTGSTGRTSRTGIGSSTSGGIGDMYGGGGSNTRSRDRSRSTQSATGRSTETGRSTDRRRSSRSRTGTTDPMTDTLGLYGNDRLGDGRGGTLKRTPTTNDVYYDLDEVALTRLTDFSKLREPMLFWAHDDTPEPKSTYRYRVRLGVFNPVAGTNQLSEQSVSLKNKVIIWSDFSDVTEPVEIPGRSYFFARDIQEAAKTITVTVCQYVLGHWYTEDFKIRQGEVIGDVVEIEPDKPKTPRGRNQDVLGGRFGGITRPEEKTNVPEKIDYGTGAVMVDAMPMNDWWGDKALRTRHYYDMLYSFDGINIDHMPVGTTYWSKDMQSTYSNISRLSRETQEPFKDFSSSRRRGGLPGQGGAYDGMEMYDEMMYESQMMEGMDGRGRR